MTMPDITIMAIRNFSIELFDLHDTAREMTDIANQMQVT